MTPQQIEAQNRPTEKLEHCEEYPMPERSGETSSVVRKSGGLTVDDRITRIEESIDRLISKIDDALNLVRLHMEKSEALTRRVENLESVVYGAWKLVGAAFITGLLALVWKVSQ